MPKESRTHKVRSNPGKSKPLAGSAELFALGSKDSEHLRPKDATGSPSSSSKQAAPAGPPKLKSSKDQRLPTSSSSGGASASSTAGLDFSRRVELNPAGESLWEDTAKEVDPVALVHTVLEDEEASDERIESVLCGAAKQLRNSRNGKPDPMLSVALMVIAKAEPTVFRFENVQAAFGSLLRVPENAPGSGSTPSAAGYKSTKSCLGVLVSNVLMMSHMDTASWPEEWVSGFIEDSLGDRTWVDGDECRGFVRNLTTAFGTRLPSVNLNPLEGFEAEPEIDPERLDSAVPCEHKHVHVLKFHRFKHCQKSVGKMTVSAVDAYLNRRQPWEAVGRHVVKLLISAAGIPGIRLTAASKIEAWLGNPKLSRLAGDLLRTLAANLNPVTVETDKEVITNFLRIRPKAKPQLNQFLVCIKEAVSQNPEILAYILKLVFYNELSNTRNPNNMQIIATIFQTNLSQATAVLAGLFMELLKQEEDYLRALKLLFREIVRALRHEFRFAEFARELYTGGSAWRDFRASSAARRERVFHGLVEIGALAIVLAVSPSVKEAALAMAKGERHKDLTPLVNFHRECSEIQRDAVYWIHTRTNDIFAPSSHDYVRGLHKLFWIDQNDFHWTLDSWPAENEKSILARIAAEIPVLEDTLLRLTAFGYSRDHPFKAADALELVDALVRRCAAAKSDLPMLVMENTQFPDLLFKLTQYFHPEGTNFPENYSAPTIAIVSHYWKAWQVLVLVTAHNPASFGEFAYEEFPTLALFLEMCITNQFSWLPVGVLPRDKCEELRVKEAQAVAFEKPKMLEYEFFLAGRVVSEESSQLLSTVITLDIRGSPRKPPQQILAQLKALNATFRVGHLLCRSRSPDFLLKILDRQQASQALPWLGALVESCEGAFDMLPIPCLCEFLMIDSPQQNQKPTTQTRKQQVVAHLSYLVDASAFQDSQDQQQPIDLEEDERAAENRVRVLDYFFQRLSSELSSVRKQAGVVLNLLLRQNNGDVGMPDHPSWWLIKKLPKSKYLVTVLPQLTRALRQCDVRAVSAYLTFIAEEIVGFKGGKLALAAFTELMLDLATVVVERNIIIDAVLKPSKKRKNLEEQRTSLEALLTVFAKYFRAHFEARKSNISPPGSESNVTITWVPAGKFPDVEVPLGVLHATFVLLTYGPPHGGDASCFHELCALWFDLHCRPSAFQGAEDGIENEIALFPDWLALRMLRCNFSQAADAALAGIKDPGRLVVFFQSFGVPVNNMSKLLAALDACVDADPDAVADVVSDVSRQYLLKLIEAQRERGAIGGHEFKALLLQGGEEKMDTEAAVEFNVPVVIERRRFPFAEILGVFELNKGVSQEMLRASAMRLFDCDNLLKWTPTEKRAAQASFQKAITLEIMLSKRLNPKEFPVLTTVLAVIESALSSAAPEARRSLMKAFRDQEIPTACLFNLLASAKNEVNDDRIVNTMNRVFHLAKPRASDEVPVSGVLARACDPDLAFGASSAISTSPRRVRSKLPPNATPEILESAYRTALKSCSDASAETTLAAFVEDAMWRNDSRPLVNAVASLLVDEESPNKVSILVDVLPSLDPELGSTEAMRSVLFAKWRRETGVRPQAYLLSLLTHQASYGTLAETIRAVLLPNQNAYDPTSVLDFLTACVFVPKLWQGRPKSVPRRLRPDDILGLDCEQLGRLCDYVIEECDAGGCDERSMINRMNLLLRCCRRHNKEYGDDFERLKFIVDRLSAYEDHTSSVFKLLSIVYSKRPLGVADCVTRRVEDNLSWTASPGCSPYDVVVHVVITSLGASTQRGKDWVDRLGVYEAALRRLAVRTPALVLRQFPLLAATLRGRTVNQKFVHFRMSHNLRLFQLVMDLMSDVLTPHVFHPSHAVAVLDVCQTFGQVFSTFCDEGGELLAPLASQFSNFLERYLSADAVSAVKVMDELHGVLVNLAAFYPDLRVIDDMLFISRSLPAPDAARRSDIGTWVPRPDLGNRTDRGSETSPAYVRSIVDEMTKGWDDAIILSNCLRKLESVSSVDSRSSSLLRPALDTLLRLCNSNSTRQLRTTALNLLMDCVRTASADTVDKVVKAVAVRLLRPGDDLLFTDSLLRVVPDLVAAAPNRAGELLARGAFRLALCGSKEAEKAISKSLSLLFNVKGASLDSAGNASDRYADNY
ncbi:unnamed protein product [Notodromas monacha]|uniref:Uncharacterized protein n=1 Tax=Notodromas monacha TaxID=399045 RepID=A0A7R9BLR7_9CRUS|nr:unnamed protein product [Notodromas monacha]CAG0917832.1 unnamed protein product [Notodromas monacha]